MTRESLLLLSMTAVFAAWLFVHLLLLVSVLRCKQLSRGLRALALVPVATPVLGWQAGARTRSSLWAALAIAYAALRALA